MVARPADLGILTVERLRLAASVRAPLTLAAYAMHFRLFGVWCAAFDPPRSALPASPDTLALFVVDQLNRGRKISTVTLKVTSVVNAHLAAGLPSPAGGEVALLFRGAQRLRQEHPVQKEPISVAMLRRFCELPCVGMTDTRNKAILLFIFATALRRSNVVKLDLSDLVFSALGFAVHVGHSKTDQTGIGFDLPVPFGQHETCPVKAMENWLKFRGMGEGPLFKRIESGRGARGCKLLGRMNANRINLVIKALMKRLGLNPDHFGSHSGRAGHVTEALAAGVDHLVVMRTTRHKSVATLQKYDRERDPFRSNSCASLGL